MHKDGDVAMLISSGVCARMIMNSPAAVPASPSVVSEKARCAHAVRFRPPDSPCTSASVRHAEAIIDHATVTQ